MNDMSDPPPARPAVAHDMAAIFGEGQRVAPRRPAAAAAGRSAGRRGVAPAKAALLLGALGVAVAGGAMLGRDAVGPMAPSPAAAAASPPSTVALRSAAPPPAPEVPASIAPVSSPPVGVVAPAPLREVAVVAAAAPVAAPRPRPAAAPVAAAPTPAPAVFARAEPVPVARTRCFGEDDCLNVRLYEGDGEVAQAYRAATRAGVRAGTLREYRSEWLRARDVAERRPREALRIYGMIAADLSDLAGDAAADDGMPPS